MLMSGHFLHFSRTGQGNGSWARVDSPAMDSYALGLGLALEKHAAKDAVFAAGRDAASQYGHARDFFLFSSLLEKKKSQDEDEAAKRSATDVFDIFGLEKSFPWGPIFKSIEESIEKGEIGEDEFN